MLKECIKEIRLDFLLSVNKNLTVVTFIDMNLSYKENIYTLDGEVIVTEYIDDDEHYFDISDVGLIYLKQVCDELDLFVDNLKLKLQNNNPFIVIDTHTTNDPNAPIR